VGSASPTTRQRPRPLCGVAEANAWRLLDPWGVHRDANRRAVASGRYSFRGRGATHGARCRAVLRRYAALTRCSPFMGPCFNSGIARRGQSGLASCSYSSMIEEGLVARTTTRPSVARRSPRCRQTRSQSAICLLARPPRRSALSSPRVSRSLANLTYISYPETGSSGRTLQEDGSGHLGLQAAVGTNTRTAPATNHRPARACPLAETQTPDSASPQSNALRWHDLEVGRRPLSGVLVAWRHRRQVARNGLNC